jgi:hypothetical protein
MRVFTILNHGTTYYQGKDDKEIINVLGNHLDGEAYRDYLICDGPGSGPRGRLMPGKFDPFTKERTAKRKSPAWSRTPFKTIEQWGTGEQGPQFYTPTAHRVVRHLAEGAVSGAGWDDNIRHAIAVLADLEEREHIDRINMAGWSRGAVTCLRMANWIKEFLNYGTEINIFAVDPVAGLDAGDKLADTYSVPENVKRYVGILAIDEARGDFPEIGLEKVRVASPEGTSVLFLPFPGVHDHIVKTDTDHKLHGVGKMIKFLACRFLTRLGTAFNEGFEVPMSREQVCNTYATMMLKRPQYAALETRSFVRKQMGGMTTRQVAQHLSQYVYADPGFFVNEHHRACFRSAFPGAYTYFFTGAPPTGLATKSYRASSQQGGIFQDVYQRSPKSYDLLSARYTLERKGGDPVPGAPAYWSAAAPGVGNIVPEGRNVAPALMELLL